MYELDVIAALYGCDNTDVGDLSFLFSRGKKQQVAGMEFFDLNLFSHFGLGGCLAGQGNVYSTVGIGGKAGAIEARTRVATPLVRRTCKGSGRFDNGVNFLIAYPGLPCAGA